MFKGKTNGFETFYFSQITNIINIKKYVGNSLNQAPSVQKSIVHFIFVLVIEEVSVNLVYIYKITPLYINT